MDNQIYLYLYIEEGKQCNLCNEMKIELFSCNLCHFVCCSGEAQIASFPKCFYLENYRHCSCFIE